MVFCFLVIARRAQHAEAISFHTREIASSGYARLAMTP
jgi:hypothetical protein